MKQRDVVFSKQALRDLEKQTNRIVEATGSEVVASRYRGRLLENCSLIGAADEGGRPRDDIRPGLRSWVFERRLIILYRVEEEKVLIVRVFDGRQDYSKLFRRDST